MALKRRALARRVLDYSSRTKKKHHAAAPGSSKHCAAFDYRCTKSSTTGRLRAARSVPSYSSGSLEGMWRNMGTAEDRQSSRRDSWQTQRTNHRGREDSRGAC